MEICWFPLVILYIFTTDFLKAQKTNRPDIQFNQIIDGYTLTTLLGLSLDECWKNCEQRAVCTSINYQRKTHVCQLNSDAKTRNLTKQVGYVFLEKRNYRSLVECGAAACTDGEECDSKANMCKIKECKRPEESEGIYIKGNLLATGSERKIECKPGFMPLHKNKFYVTSVCQNGTWNKHPECVPLNCERLAGIGTTFSNMYNSYDKASQKIINIFCEFNDAKKTGYTFIAPNTLNSDINISNYYSRCDHVMLRFVSNMGHFASKMEVLPAYRGDYNVSIFISEHPYFNPPTGFVTAPYMYMGFVPVSFGNHQGKTMGYSCNGHDYTFRNSDGNPNNYFAIFESLHDLSNERLCWGGGYVHDGWKTGSVAVSPTLPDTVFFDWYEIHMGGGGCLVRNCDVTVHGIAFGLPFDY